MNDHRLAYHVELKTDFPFVVDLPAGRGSRRLSFDTARALGEPDPIPARPVFQSPHRGSTGEPLFALWELSRGHLLRSVPVGDFLIEERCIRCSARTRDTSLIETVFLGSSMAFWLELRGVVTLHASAVSINGRAAVLVAPRGGGKTTLAAALVRAGHPLLGDDIVALEREAGRLEVLPAYPLMRMWPPMARHFAGEAESLLPVAPGLEKLRVPVGGTGFGSFSSSPAPLGQIYLLRREEAVSRPTIRVLGRPDTVFALARHSFLQRLTSAAGLDSPRFDRLSRLARDIRLRQLTFPAGLEQLPEVISVLCEDVAASASGDAPR